MDIEENEAGGKSVILFADDNLDDVPESHRGLITPAIRMAFADPIDFFNDIADRCPFPAMQSWLDTLIASERCYLSLHRSPYPEYSGGGFSWLADGVRGAEIASVEEPALSDVPPDVAQFDSLVRYVDWMAFGCAGGLYGGKSRNNLLEYDYQYHGADIDPAQTFEFGCSTCGDKLIYTADGRGGWMCHENGQIHLLGTFSDTLEWVFTELNADRCPEFDYNKWI